MKKSNTASNDFADKGDGYQEQVVAVRRVSTVVKGGRKFSFSALVVVGDGNGKVGVGFGGSKEVPVAIQKAMANARRNLISIELNGETLFHPIKARHGASKIVMMPAAEGTGVIAGGAMRSVFEVLGVRNVMAKCLGSTNPINVVYATIKGLQNMRSPNYIAKKRGISVQKVLGINENE